VPSSSRLQRNGRGGPKNGIIVDSHECQKLRLLVSKQPRAAMDLTLTADNSQNPGSVFQSFDASS
jgi:hypothetical protein